MNTAVYYRALFELAAYFLRLGVTAFGGPAAHIALMEEDCVRRRGWITHQRFLDVLGAANMIPGPTSTELAMHIGYSRAGWSGLVVAGACFIAPAAVIVGLLAAVYVNAGALPALDRALRIVKPVVVVVVASAVLSLARAIRWSGSMVAVAVFAIVMTMLGANEVIIIVLAGIIHMLARVMPRSAAMAVVPVPQVFAYFVKAGSLVLGSGYVLLPILRGDLVDRGRWITEAQLLDAIAVGQVTPGPIFTAATFIGYLVAGSPGAVAATIGIFLPAFIFSAISVRILDRLSREPLARSFLDGVNAAAVALIGAVVIGLAQHAIMNAVTACAAGAALLLVVFLRVNAAWVIVGAAALGLIL
jgi:chromate transporter